MAWRGSPVGEANPTQEWERELWRDQEAEAAQLLTQEEEERRHETDVLYGAAACNKGEAASRCPPRPRTVVQGRLAPRAARVIVRKAS